jgi:hypothetical protein
LFRREPGSSAFTNVANLKRLQFPDDYPWAAEPRDDGRGNALLAARIEAYAAWFFTLAMLPALASGKPLDQDYLVGLGLSLTAAPFLIGWTGWRLHRKNRVLKAYGPGRVQIPNCPLKKGRTVDVALTTAKPIPNLRAVLWNVTEYVRGSGEDEEHGRRIEQRFPVEINREENPDGTWTTVFSAATSPTSDPTALWTKEPAYWQLRVEGGDPRAPYRLALFVPVY